MSFQHSPAQTQTGHQVSMPFPFTALAPPSFPSRPGTSIFMDCRSEGSLTVDDYARRWTSKDICNRYRRQLITSDILPDDVLLEIFDFRLNGDIYEYPLCEKRRIEKWIRLAHVCRRWRSVIFQSPHRLDLQLLCTPKTPARDTLDIWPPLPIHIYSAYELNEPSSVDNIIAALEHNDRVCEIELEDFTNSQLEYITNSAAMQKPFLKLTDLNIAISKFEDDEPRPILPNSFLDGTAPRLRHLDLSGVPFPVLPKLLLSATHLVDFRLYNIPRSGYIPPELMATSLTALTSLEYLYLRFRYPRPRPAIESRRPPPRRLTRSILPRLTEIAFTGASEYLEEILARVDAPRLNQMFITFFNQIIFDTPQLFQFINRRPTLRAPKEGRIVFGSEDITVRFPSQTSHLESISVRIRCTASEWQLSSIEQLQVCTSSSPLLSTLDDLYIFEDRLAPPRWQDDVENTLWLDLLRSFVAVKNLYLSEEFVPRVALALQELVGGRTTEVLPTLENIFLERFQPSGPFHEGIEKFIAARQLTSHPVAVSHWDTDSKREKQRDTFHFYI